MITTVTCLSVYSIFFLSLLFSLTITIPTFVAADFQDKEERPEIIFWLPTNDTVPCLPFVHQRVFPWYEFNETTIRVHSTEDGTPSVFYSVHELNHSFYYIKLPPGFNIWIMAQTKYAGIPKIQIAL